MCARVLAGIITVLLFAPATVRAVTVDDIVGLSKSGVTDSVLIALIDADQTVFNLTPQQIADLKRAGVSDDVVVKMLGTAREFRERMRALAEQTPFEPAPEVVIIGEKPPSQERAYDWPFNAPPAWWPVEMPTRPPFLPRWR
jgi:hypothetical protein